MRGAITAWSLGTCCAWALLSAAAAAAAAAAALVVPVSQLSAPVALIVRAAGRRPGARALHSSLLCFCLFFFLGGGVGRVLGGGGLGGFWGIFKGGGGGCGEVWGSGFGE